METAQATTYYTWRERNEDGRLLIPCADPTVHETPFDFIFDTIDKAIAGLAEFAAPYDSKTWVLVHCTETIVDMTAEMPALLRLETDMSLHDAYYAGGSSGVWEWVKQNHPEWSVGFCTSCEEHNYIYPDNGTDYCSVCWEVL